MSSHAMGGHVARLILGLSFALTATGCGGSADRQQGAAADEKTGQTKQAFSGFTMFTLGLVSNSTPRVNIGSDSDQTCFLAGVTGNLSAYNDTYAFAGVLEDEGSYWLQARDATGTEPVLASAVCLPTTRNRTQPATWLPGMATLPLSRGDTSTVCGLTWISTNGGDNDFSDTNDMVFLATDGQTWEMQGFGNVIAGAQCVDVNVPNAVLQINRPSNMEALTLFEGSDALGVQCFLSGVGGRFIWDDWNSGVQVQFLQAGQGSSATAWQVLASGGKFFDVRCVR